MTTEDQAEEQGELHVVTGAYGFTGKYIADRLLKEGKRVRTLTHSITREQPLSEHIEAYPFNFDRPARLAESLEGAHVLYNTYWVRFDYKEFSHEQAIENSRRLFQAAKRAGVGKVVHVSITNPSMESDLSYFSGKARLESMLQQSGLAYTILRPALVFGKEDILINNIAWILRRFPVFGMFGDGSYRLQPIYVEDLAELTVQYGQHIDSSEIVDAIGPETFTFYELVQTISEAIDVHRPIVRLPPSLGMLAGRLIGAMMDDVVVTRQEIDGLMRELLYTDAPAAGTTRLSQWVRRNSEHLGRRYANELARRRDRQTSFEKL